MLTFSERYLKPESMQAETPRLRVQLLAVFEHNQFSWECRLEVVELLRFRSGVEVPSGYDSFDWDVFFKRYEFRDILDSLSYFHLSLVNSRRQGQAIELVQAVQRAFDIQHAKYRMDLDGSILLRVDENFETDRLSTLAGLERDRYRGAKVEFASAYDALSARDPDGKRAIRGVFEACEVVFKLMFEAHRIGAPEIGTHLSPLIERHYGGDLPAQAAAKKLVQAFTAWVAAAQFYRHGQGQQEPNQPPLELAVLLLSEGASHLRWLIHLDQAKLGAGS